jgi:hypothetical protein
MLFRLALYVVRDLDQLSQLSALGMYKLYKLPFIASTEPLQTPKSFVACKVGRLPLTPLATNFVHIDVKVQV